MEKLLESRPSWIEPLFDCFWWVSQPPCNYCDGCRGSDCESDERPGARLIPHRSSKEPGPESTVNNRIKFLIFWSNSWQNVFVWFANHHRGEEEHINIIQSNKRRVGCSELWRIIWSNLSLSSRLTLKWWCSVYLFKISIPKVGWKGKYHFPNGVFNISKYRKTHISTRLLPGGDSI